MSPRYAVYACTKESPDALIGYFDELHQAEHCANECNLAATDTDSPADYRACEIGSILRESEILMMQSLHYYGCEFPGNTWDDIPDDLVREGLNGLDAFLRIAMWSRDKKDPMANVGGPIPF